MYDNSTDTAYYDGKFGTLTINFKNRTVEDALDH